MANIGCRYAYFEPSGGSPTALGGTISLSVNMNRTQLSALQDYRTRIDGANVTIDTDRMPSTALFNTIGNLYWCIVRQLDGTKDYLCCKLSDVTLQRPDYSTATKGDSTEFNTYNITGTSRTHEEVSFTAVSTAAEALTLIQAGW